MRMFQRGLLLPKDQERDSWAAQMGVLVTIPFVLAVPPIVGWAIGSWLDRLLSTAPVLMYLFIILGILAGAREFYRIVKRYGNGS